MQTHRFTNFMTIATAALLLTASGCSSGPFAKNENPGERLSSTGPNVLNARAEPDTVKLNEKLQSNQPAEVLADVKDYRSPVKEVRLQFVSVPLEVPMHRIAGTTWRGVISPMQLQMLAVSGKTARYEANVIAVSEDGQSSMSKEPVKIAVKAPDLATSKTG